MGFIDVLPAFIADPIRDALKTPVRQSLHQFLNLGLIVASALMSWKTLILLTGSDSPVVVVLSGSMEPAFYRGDILFLNMGTAPLRTGEIVVYNAEEESSIPVVHRIIEVHERQDSKYVDILTKGDNNPGNDRQLFRRGRRWLQQEHIIGRAVGFLPGVGMITIVMNDYPWLKYTVIGVLGLLCLLGFDE